jgi:putative tricarboxylic transport membrane protein
MTDRVILVGIAILAAVYLNATEHLPSLEIGDPLGPKAFPRLLAGALILTGIFLLVEIVRARKTAPVVTRSGPPETGTYLLIAGVVVWTFVYFQIFERLGYIIATSIYLLAMMAYFNRGKWVANVITTIVFCIASYWMFKTLGVTLPPGILPF